MVTRLNPEQIAQLLNESTRQLDKNTVSALFNARQNALRKLVEHVPAYTATTPHGHLHWTDRLIPHTFQQWLAVGLIIAAMSAGAGLWQHSQEQQISELDVAILTDDVPLEALVD